MRAGYCWICRLDFHDRVPDRTTIVKFHKRCGRHGLWEELFHRIVPQCRDVGLLSGDPAELIATEAYRSYYMHNTSHWLGLDVHDVGTYRDGGEPRALVPGMCFTIEPGLYVPADAEDADPRFRGIGIRIEDDVVVTETGHENLTAEIPKRVDDIEAWMREA